VPVGRGLLVLGRYDRPTLDRLARLADETFDTLWYADERFFRECYAALTYCGCLTRRVELGPCVTDPYSRHPALTAAAIATLDELSGGRAILGIGAGVSGFSQLGIDRARPAVAVREMIQLVRALLRGERLSFEGRVIRFQDGELDFPARPDVPIYVAAQGPRILEVAGELADGVIVEAYSSPTALAWVRERVGAGAARAGRDRRQVSLVARLDTCITADRHAAQAVIKPRIARTLMLDWPDLASLRVRGLEAPPALLERVAGVGYTRDPAILGPAAVLVPDEWVPQFALAGTPDDVAGQLQTLVEAGVDKVIAFPLPVESQTVDSAARAFAALAAEA
jgi:5,10-methylenetetrahydromethanopterin reductase